MLPLNGALPRHIRSNGPQDPTKNRWQRIYVVSLTVFASAILATLVTFGVLNFLLNGMTLPPVSTQTGLLQTMQDPEQMQSGAANIINPDVGDAAASIPQPDDGIPEQPADVPAEPPVTKGPPPVFHHPFDDLQGVYKLPAEDTSPRCQQSHMCDGDHSCGPDKLGCVTSPAERKAAVRKAIAWAWEGYRKYAWGHDEVDVLTQSPHAWFNLGLTIVDSLDTLLIAGLMDEYHQARHWVANHLIFHDGSNVQFFEVNIRILGGLVSAYYLSGGDDLYLHKAEMLSDRLLVAFNTSSGLPVTYVPLKDRAGRAKAGMSDANTNIAEAGTISMEFTSIGRLLGRDDLFDAGMHFWYVLMSSRNFSGLYCMGIHTSRADCYNPAMTIGSAADSTYEYMLKQWIMSGHTQEVPLELYKSSMNGVRKYLVRHVWDGHEESSIVSEARADTNSGVIGDTNNRFEHLTCFAGGMFVLGALHGVNTEVDENDFHDVVLGARIGRACYELYHQAASGLAPDSVTYKQANGQPLPHRDQDTTRAPGIMKRRPGGKRPSEGVVLQPPFNQADATFSQRKLNTPAQDGSHPAEAASAPQQQADSGAESHEQHPQQAQEHDLHTAQGEAGAAAQQHTRRARHLMSVDDDDEELHSRRQLVQDGRPMRDSRHDDDRHEQLHSMHERAAEDYRRFQMHERGAAEHQHMPHDGEVLLRMPHRHMQEVRERDEDRPHLSHNSRRMHADAEPDRAGQPQPQIGSHGLDPIKAAQEREAHIAAMQNRFAEQQREKAQQQAEARKEKEQQHLAAAQQQQQQQQAPQQQQEQQQKQQRPAEQQQQQAPASAPVAAASTTSPSPSPSPSPPPPPPPSPPPPPAEPVKVSWSQMTGADFLRPETIETLFYLWRATGDDIYREWGWNMFRAFERWTRKDTGGYATITNVNQVPPGLANKMESFFLAETLKYFYLLFEDDPNVLPLDQWVFNTEAHPLPIWGTPADKQAMSRLKQRRHAARAESKRHKAEEDAVAELMDIKQQGAELAKHGSQQGRPADREGYGLGGVEMY